MRFRGSLQDKLSPQSRIPTPPFLRIFPTSRRTLARLTSCRAGASPACGRRPFEQPHAGGAPRKFCIRRVRPRDAHPRKILRPARLPSRELYRKSQVLGMRIHTGNFREFAHSRARLRRLSARRMACTRFLRRKGPALRPGGGRTARGKAFRIRDAQVFGCHDGNYFAGSSGAVLTSAISPRKEPFSAFSAEGTGAEEQACKMAEADRAAKRAGTFLDFMRCRLDVADGSSAFPETIFHMFFARASSFLLAAAWASGLMSPGFF